MLWVWPKGWDFGSWLLVKLLVTLLVNLLVTLLAHLLVTLLVNLLVKVPKSWQRKSLGGTQEGHGLAQLAPHNEAVGGLGELWLRSADRLC